MVKGAIIRRVVKGGAIIGANARAAAKIKKVKTKATVQVIRQKATTKVKKLHPRAIKKRQIKGELETNVEKRTTTEVVGATHFAPKRIEKKAHGRWVDTDPETGQQTITLAKVGAPAAVGAGSLGIVGTAYAATNGKQQKAPDPFGGVVAVGQDFYTGVTNVGSDYASIVTGGESKMSMNRLFEAGIDQIGMYGWDRPAFEAHSQAGTLPFDKALGKAAEKPVATHVGEIVTEAGIWAGTLGVGRGVKLAKLSSKKNPVRSGLIMTGTGRDGTISTTGSVFHSVTPFPSTAKGGAKKGLQEAWASTKKDPFGVQTLGREGIKGRMVGKTEYSLPKPRSAKNIRKVQLKRYEDDMMDRLINLEANRTIATKSTIKRNKVGKLRKKTKKKYVKGVTKPRTGFGDYQVYPY